MASFLRQCKSNIIKLVSDNKCELKCSVFGTLGSFGITILWLADQYVDILRMVTKIKNINIGKESSISNEASSVFLSAYTIFAENHVSDQIRENKLQTLKGDAIIHLTLKQGMLSKIAKELENISVKSYFHCTGENDIVWIMAASDALPLFNSKIDALLYYNSRFYKNYILQTNVQLCETHVLTDSEQLMEDKSKKGQGKISSDYLPLLEEIQKNIKICE